MKVLFITSSLEPKDGWGRYSNVLVREVSKTGQVLVICHSTFDVPGVSQKQLLHSTHSVINLLKIFSSSRGVQRQIDSFEPDIIHFLVEPYVVLLPFLRLSSSIKKFLTVHGTYSFLPSIFIREKIKLKISGWLIQKAYSTLSTIISVSSFTREHLLDQYRDFYRIEFPPEKVVVVSNGIDLSNFSFNNTPKDTYAKRSILFVGAVKRRKGVLEAVSALAEYKKIYGNNFVYTIVGQSDDDRYVGQVTSEIQELGLENQVVWKGIVGEKELRELYTQADLFLMLPVDDGPSIEGFGFVYLEANSYGVPTIGSWNSGARDAISDGVSGFLADPFNPSEVSEKIKAVLVDNIIQAEACRQWAQKQNIQDKVYQIQLLYGKK